MKVAILGIGTNVGKTVASAIIVESMHADYWKPVQAGNLRTSDSITIKKLISNRNSFVFPERYKLRRPMSPHMSVKYDKIEVKVNELKMPNLKGPLLVVESVGGILSPLSNTETFVDFLKLNSLKTILVTKNYLGSINHTMLSIEYLKHSNIECIGLIVNGIANKETESYLLQKSNLPIILKIPFSTELNKDFVKKIAIQNNKKLSQIFNMDYENFI